LIIPLMVAISLLSMPVKDTVWWDTPGGKVTEHHDEDGKKCSLMLYDNDGSVTFEWGQKNKTLVTAVDSNWALPNNWKGPVALQVGNVWLSNGAGSAIIDAVGQGTAVAFTTDLPVDDLLRSSGQIVVKNNSADLSIKLEPAKMRKLSSRTRKCLASKKG
jgi:hypothetical protein